MNKMITTRSQFDYLSFDIEFSLGEKIRIYRIRARLSQLQIELFTDLSPGTLSRIENNLINPTKETLVKIIKELKLSKEEIVDLFGC